MFATIQINCNMKRRISILGTLIFIFLTGSAFIITEWVQFQKDNYKIFFPQSPSTDSTVAETKIGTITIYTHMYESPENSKDSNLVYGLSATDYPAKYVLPNDKAFLKGFFEGAVKGAVGNLKGKLLSEKDIIWKNYPGKEIKIDYGNGAAIVTMKIILVKERVFGLQTISFPGKENNANATKFYDSFDIQ
jgi:hypothetical protein